MKDEAFLKLEPLEARRHANFQGEPEESRLKALYRDKRGVVLDDADGFEALGSPDAPAGTETPSLSGAAWTLIVMGAAVAGFAFLFDVGVGSGSAGVYGLPDRVANLDKIAVRHMLMATGLALFVSGWVLVGADHVAQTVWRARSGGG